MKSLKVLVLFAVLVLSKSSLAFSDIQIGEPAYGGSGCPAGTAFVGATTDNKEIHIVPESFAVENEARGVQRASCMVAIPIQVPEDLQIAVVVDGVGFAWLGSRSQLQINHEIFLAGGERQIFEKNLQGPYEDPFTLGDEQLGQPNWSACGVTTNLRLNTSLLARGHAFANIEQIVLKIISRRCRD